MESILFLTPFSHDDGATLVCRARSQALPSGKDTAVTLNLQCECSWTLALKPEILGERGELMSKLQGMRKQGIVDLKLWGNWKLEAWTLSSKRRGDGIQTPGVKGLGTRILAHQWKCSRSFLAHH